MQKEGVLNNIFWKFAERITAQMVTLIVSVILARLLDPEHYGIIAIVTIFITIANVFVSDGLGSALIQKQNPDKLDYSSVLYFNIFLSVVLYIVLFVSAPYIAKFYGKGYEVLTPVLRVLSFRLILSAINSVQQAYISKKMIFKKFFWATLFGTCVSAIVGVAMAYMGFGVWALVMQYLTNTVVDTLVLAITLKKWPILKFSWIRVKQLFGFGFKILITNLLVTGYLELKAIIIGKMYSSSDLAYYDQGKKFPNLIVTNINTSIGAVLFPKMASEQNQIGKIKNTTRVSIRFSAFLMCPMMLGLATIARPFVSLLLTEKWLPCVPLLQLFCIIYLFQPIHTANMQAIKALGESDIFLKIELVKKAIELIILIITANISVKAIVIGMAVLTTLFTFINAYPNIKLLNYTFKEQMEDIIPTVINSLIMAGVAYFCGTLFMNDVIKITVQVMIGIMVYIIICMITKNKEFSYLVGFIKKGRGVQQ